DYVVHEQQAPNGTWTQLSTSYAAGGPWCPTLPNAISAELSWPAAASLGGGSLVLAEVGPTNPVPGTTCSSDQHVWVRGRYGVPAGDPSGWFPWSDIGTPTPGYPLFPVVAVATINAPTTAYAVFVGGADGTLYARAYIENGWTPWINSGVK